MKLIVAGSRDITDRQLIYIELDNYPWVDDLEIVSGCARGPDTIAKDWAEFYNFPVKEFPADWDTYGKAAGHIRNAQMADYADELLVFWDGQSRGTKSMIDEARKRKMKTTIIYV